MVSYVHAGIYLINLHREVTIARSCFNEAYSSATGITENAHEYATPQHNQDAEQWIEKHSTDNKQKPQDKIF